MFAADIEIFHDQLSPDTLAMVIIIIMYEQKLLITGLKTQTHVTMVGLLKPGWYLFKFAVRGGNHPCLDGD